RSSVRLPVSGRSSPPAAPEPSPTRIIGVPTGTVAPSSTSSASTTPAYGLGSSTSDLAVSISTMTSLTLMASPGLTFHETISASVRPSPTSGSLNTSLTAASPPQYAIVRSTASSTRSRSGRYSSSTLAGGYGVPNRATPSTGASRTYKQ